MDIDARLTELAKTTGAATPVVSVYLNTRWADEQQRERVRVFLKKELRKARQGAASQELAEDLDWIQAAGESLIEQAQFPEAHGVALFACRSLGVREVLPVRVPFEDVFVVSDAPFLRPLAAALEETPSTLVVFVDGESARLIPLNPEGAGEEVALESEVPGRHRQGGWALLAQSRYQRHIHEHRGRHFEAVAEALAHLVEGSRVQQIVLAGQPRTISIFSKHLPQPILGRIVGSVSAARHEPASAMSRRALETLAGLEEQEKGVAVDAVLTEAAKGGRAVAGVDETLEAVTRGAVDRLFILNGFRESGGVCRECGALQSGPTACRLCGKETESIELGEAMVERVIAAGGKTETIGIHQGLARVGGVAARLRYPL